MRFWNDPDAATKTGRWVRAFEIDCHYCDGAILRQETFTGQVAVLAATAGTFEEVAERRDEERNAAPKLSEEHAMLGEAGVNSSKSDSKVVMNEPQ